MIVLDRFLGEIPRVDPQILPQQFAAEAYDCRLEDGTLMPLGRHGGYEEPVASDATWFTLIDGDVYEFAEFGDMVPGPVDSSRMYFSGAGFTRPQMFHDDNYYDLRLQSPSPAVSVSTPDYDADNPDNVTRVIVYTYVTSFGEESAPSPASAEFVHAPGDDLDISFSDTAPTGRAITGRRIYVLETSLTGVNTFLFWAEITHSQSTYNNNNVTFELNEPLPTADFNTPPDALEGLTAMPNGMIAGFRGNQVLFCEPYQPHAWPTKYRRRVNYPIVGLVAMDSTLVILTEGEPYIAQGLHPEEMGFERIEENKPCLARRGIVDLGYAAAYPSTDGLILIAPGQGARNASASLFTRDQWAELKPASFRAALYRGRYVFSYNPFGEDRAMGFLDVAGENPFFYRAAVAAHHLHYSRADGILLRLDKTSNFVVGFDFVDPQDEEYPYDSGPAQWRSKEFQYSGRTGFGAILVQGRPLADNPAPFVAVEVSVDGEVVSTKSGLNTIFRLPPTRGLNWQIRVVSNEQVTRILMGASPTEIANYLAANA